MSIMVGVGRGARAGVLIKNAEALELMEKVDTLVVDKTGTLTEGRPVVTHIVSAAGGRRRWSEEDLLRLAAGVERASEHPLAHAIVTAAGQRGLAIPAAVDFDAPVGLGVVGTVEGHRVVLGSQALLLDHGIDPGSLAWRPTGSAATVPP